MRMQALVFRGVMSATHLRAILKKCGARVARRALRNQCARTTGRIVHAKRQSLCEIDWCNRTLSLYRSYCVFDRFRFRKVWSNGEGVVCKFIVVEVGKVRKVFRCQGSKIVGNWYHYG